MRLTVDETSPSWLEIGVELSPTDIANLIASLQSLLKDQSQHFHLTNGAADSSNPVVDIEFLVQGGDMSNAMNTGPAILPNR